MLTDLRSLKLIDWHLPMLIDLSSLKLIDSRSLKRIGWSLPMLIDSHLLKQTDLSLRTLTG